jgi:hypothetical protein
VRRTKASRSDVRAYRRADAGRRIVGLTARPIEETDVNAKAAIRNKTWAELQEGDSASIERICSVQDLLAFDQFPAPSIR